MIKLSPKRSCCPVSCTLDILGDRWTLVIVRDLFRGVTRYADFRRSPEGIATNILAQRLSMLVTHGLVEQFDEPGKKRPAYRLTERGQSMAPLLKSVAEWGIANIEGSEARLAPSGMI